MKNLLIIIALAFGLGLYSSAQAQNDEMQNQRDDAGYTKSDDPDKTPADREADREDKSKVGNVLHKTGNAIGSGAKWTWDKAKHNKLTKNGFNQPDDK